MKNKSLAMAVIFSLLICSGLLLAKERRGAEVKIVKKDMTALKGELVVVKPTSLLLLDSYSGVDVSVDIGDIHTITIIWKSKALPGLLIGLGAGFLLGSVVGNSGGPGEGFGPSAEMIGGALIMLVSPLIGLTAGALMGADQKIQMAGMSPEQIKADLEKLRRQARISNF